MARQTMRVYGNTTMLRIPAVAALLVAATVLFPGVSARGEGDGATFDVRGRAVFTSTTENCQSPLGLCATGEYRGDLRGHSFNTALQIIPSAPARIFFFHEDEVIHLQGGDITTKVSAAANFIPGGEIASIHKITGGTGDYEGATGFLTFTGAADETGLGASLKYRGEVHLP